MSHSRYTRTPVVLAATIAASFCAVAQAGPVKTIYSAENALYGAGYEIGKADGWMDNTLRSAIRQYQSEHDELKANGNLDPQTLSALGIAHGDNSTISGNTVADRSAAMAALGLEENRSGSGSAGREIAAAPAAEAQPEPETVPEPEAESVPEAEPAPLEEPETEPAADIASISEEKFRQEPVEQATEEPVEPATEEPVTEPEPPARTAEPEPQPESEPAVETELATAPEEEVLVEVVTVEEPTEADFELPEEPTAAGNPEVSEPAEEAEVVQTPTSPRTEPASQSSGGLFSSLFDFLFGWLI